jgi:hypothetical protein
MVLPRILELRHDQILSFPCVYSLLKKKNTIHLRAHPVFYRIPSLVRNVSKLLTPFRLASSSP